MLRAINAPPTTSLHCWPVSEGSSSKISFQSLVPRTASGSCLRFGSPRGKLWDGDLLIGAARYDFRNICVEVREEGRQREKLRCNAIVTGASDDLMGSSGAGVDLWSCSSWGQGPGPFSPHVDQALDAGCAQGVGHSPSAEGSSWRSVELLVPAANTHSSRGMSNS